MVEVIDLRKVDNRKIFTELQPIIDENLAINGGTLAMGNILSRDFEWTHLFLVRNEEGKIIGFAILRYSSYDQHITGFDNYYYISDIVIAKEYQGQGYGTLIVKKILETVTDLPVVSSVHEENAISLKLFSRYMISYSKVGSYYRFMDSKSFILKNGDSKIAKL